MVSLEAKGVNGQITFDGATVVIRREGFFGRTSHGRSEKSLAVKSIGAVQFKPATALVNGHIQFSVSGESSRHSIGFGRSQDAAKDENAVIFKKNQSPEFEVIRDAIRAAQASGESPAPDLADQLAKLAVLRDQGVLTGDEFEAKKAQLLERM